MSNYIEIEVNNFTFRGKSWGDANCSNRILAIHGWLDNANTFDKIAPELSKDHYVIAIDLAGHGISDHRSTNANYYLWDHAIDVLNCLDALQWKTCTLIAHSLGSGVASLVSGAFPNRINKLIFIDGLGPPFINNKNEIVTNFTRAYKQFKMAQKAQLYGFSKQDSVTFINRKEAIQNRVDNRISPISYKAASILIERGLKKVSGGFRWSHDPKVVLPEYYRITEEQVVQFIKKITCKTRIILGKQGLFSTGLFSSRIENFRNVDIQWIEGGHHIHLEKEHGHVSELINSFLN
ncbi:Pimeloyl-ACP methyl ester carboxylesterase [Tenacibaculum sp. MAR_2009_124]|uniref:alpha/beta fold hydrolase n=1 Tax=Tenacibaculum sp. MAR_2009_124 TaxID=1250059 RepID=UPI000896C13B|nr:alpha/beta fold hydrolase [Tenacibaculum sp. MAR_2009_124]SEB49544.1 Pimeloyl-ACP methyl ester carboxylesterase [Tenacibaculum sp. MAR_2009_124]